LLTISDSSHAPGWFGKRDGRRRAFFHAGVSFSSYWPWIWGV